MIKYLTKKYGKFIIPVEVERENEMSVWIKGRSCRKNTQHEHYFDSFEDAKNFLLGESLEKMDKMVIYLETERKRYNSICTLTNDV